MRTRRQKLQMGSQGIWAQNTSARYNTHNFNQCDKFQIYIATTDLAPELQTHIPAYWTFSLSTRLPKYTFSKMGLTSLSSCMAFLSEYHFRTPMNQSRKFNSLCRYLMLNSPSPRFYLFSVPLIYPWLPCLNSSLVLSQMFPCSCNVPPIIHLPSH